MENRVSPGNFWITPWWGHTKPLEIRPWKLSKYWHIHRKNQHGTQEVIFRWRMLIFRGAGYRISSSMLPAQLLFGCSETYILCKYLEEIHLQISLKLWYKCNCIVIYPTVIYRNMLYIECTFWLFNQTSHPQTTWAGIMIWQLYPTQIL